MAEDDEISIDFGKATEKLKGFFKKKDKKEKEPKAVEEKKEKTEEKKELKEEKDEEVSIDFSKIKDFFKKKNKEEEKKAEEKVAEKKEDEEISIDLSGIKRFFKKEETEEVKGEKEAEDEISIDLSKIKQTIKGLFKPESGEESKDIRKTVEFIKKYKTFFLIIIPVLLCIYVRITPTTAPYTQEWATNSVHSMINNDISSAIALQYPNLPDSNKQPLIQEQFQNALKTDGYTFQTGQYQGQKIIISAQIKQTANYFKTFYEYEDEQGKSHIYMPDIDPYYWYRYAKNIIGHGYPGDEIKDGQQWDNHQLAPNGKAILTSDMFHPYFLAYMYKIVHLVNPSAELIRTIQYYPVIISILVVIFVCFIAKRISGEVGGLFAAVMMAVNSAFATRTLFGHADSDAWVVFFPVIIMWLFLEAFESTKTKKRILLAVTAGALTGLFSFTWGGWWYIFDFLLGATGLYLIYQATTHYKECKTNIKAYLKTAGIKDTIIISVAYFISSGIFVSMFTSVKDFILTPILSLGFTRIKDPVLQTLWPNVLTTVAELNPGSIDQIIAAVGGLFLFYIGVAGIALSVLKKDRHGRTDAKYAILLAIWFLGTVYASTKGIRFTMMLAPAFSIAFGTAAGMVYKYLTNWTVKELHVEKIIAATIVLTLISTTMIYPANVFAQSANTAKMDVPIINDAWWNALTMIKDNSSETAIISSWWDFGHHFKAIADRRVTFDGTTQQEPQAHWIGKFLLTDNEEQAIGTLRMLDCGGNNAFNELYKTNNDTHKSIDIIYEIIMMDKENAREQLTKEYKLNNEEAEKVLQYTHCQPPEAFVIASNDMIGKSGVWAHFGSWDFEKAAIWQNAKGMGMQRAAEYMQTEFNYTKERAESTYYETQAITSESDANSWVAPWPSYAGTSSCSVKGTTAECDIGLKVDLQTKEAWFDTQQGKQYPKKFAYLTENNIEIKEYKNNTVTQDLGVLLVPSGKEYYAVLSQTPLTTSIFSRLFYTQAHGLEHFKLLTRQRSIGGEDIYVYKVEWNGGVENRMAETTPKTQASTGDDVTVEYIGYEKNGTIFDSSISSWHEKNTTKETGFEGQETTPFTFTLGQQQVITGFEEGIKGMKKGQEKTIEVPPEKGYGTDPTAHPLGNKTIYFKVKLISIA